MQDIILLHGAMGASAQLLPLKEKLKQKFTIYTPDLPGHGGSSIPAGGFSIEGFSKYLSQYIDDKKITEANIFGYSMGGYVAMYLAATSAKVRRVIR